MSKIKNISTPLAGRLAMAAGALFAAAGVVQLVDPQNTGSQVVGLAGHLNLAFFLAALMLASPTFVVLARYARPGKAEKAAYAAGLGTFVLGVTCISSLAMGHDGVWFNVIAPITNAAWLFGSIALAVSLKRAGRVPTLVAVGLPVAWVTTIPLSTTGGGLVTGAYFLTVGYLAASDALERSEAAERLSVHATRPDTALAADRAGPVAVRAGAAAPERPRLP